MPLDKMLCLISLGMALMFAALKARGWRRTR